MPTSLHISPDELDIGDSLLISSFLAHRDRSSSAKSDSGACGRGWVGTKGVCRRAKPLLKRSSDKNTKAISKLARKEAFETLVANASEPLRKTKKYILSGEGISQNLAGSRLSHSVLAKLATYSDKDWQDMHSKAKREANSRSTRYYAKNWLKSEIDKIKSQFKDPRIAEAVPEEKERANKKLLRLQKTYHRLMTKPVPRHNMDGLRVKPPVQSAFEDLLKHCDRSSSPAKAAPKPCGKGWVGTKPPGCKRTIVQGGTKKANEIREGQKKKTKKAKDDPLYDQKVAQLLGESKPKSKAKASSKPYKKPKTPTDLFGKPIPMNRKPSIDSLESWLLRHDRRAYV